MENINDMTGNDLDFFGKKNGIERYHGFAHVETDEEYRNSIRTFLQGGQIEMKETYWGVFRQINAKRCCTRMFYLQEDASSYASLCRDATVGAGVEYFVLPCSVSYRAIRV